MSKKLKILYNKIWKLKIHIESKLILIKWLNEKGLHKINVHKTYNLHSFMAISFHVWVRERLPNKIN